MQMKRLGFHAKNIIAAGYDPVSGILAVEFKSGTYLYSGVPEEKYVKLCRSPYPDRQYTLTIKGQHPVKKMESEAPKAPEPQKGNGMEFYREQDGLKFQEDGHIYTLNGNRVISLTQILDAAGLVNYDGIAPEVLANKAKFGTKVHTYCLWNDQGELDMNDLVPYPNYWNRVEGWRQFVEDFKFMPDLTWCEVPAACKVNGSTYALTVDRYGVIGEGDNIANAVIELKTCADREYHHQIQTAGQAILFRQHSESMQMPLKRYCVYLLDKKNQANRFYFCQPHDDRLDEKIFLSALMLTQTRINNKLLKGF